MGGWVREDRGGVRPCRGFWSEVRRRWRRATREGFIRERRVCAVNVVVEAGGKGSRLEFGWLARGMENRKKEKDEDEEEGSRL